MGLKIRAVYWRMSPLLVFIVLLIFFWRGLSLDPKRLPSMQIGKLLPEFHLPVLGVPQIKLNSTELKGRVSLLNVWASWCDSCAHEQDFLLSLKDQGVLIYGLNYKDDPKDALAWLKVWGNPYKLIGADVMGKVSIDLGVYGAPETFIIDADGLIRYRYVGVLNALVWKQDLEPIILDLEQAL